MSVPTEVLVASTRQDAEAVEVIIGHHAQLAGGLDVLVEALLAAAERGQADEADVVRADLVAFCRSELLPHAEGEEATLYRAAARMSELRLLVAAMTAEHARLAELVDAVASAPSALRAAAAGASVAAVFHPHLALENDVLLPRLAADPATSLADLLAAMHADVEDRAAKARQAAGRPAEGQDSGCAPGGCGCGGSAGQAGGSVPELDVRAIPHAIRHATVFGAFDAVPPGGSLVLVAPHDPKPLLRQLSDRTAGGLRVDYLERGPEAWRLLLTK